MLNAENNRSIGRLVLPIAVVTVLLLIGGFLFKQLTPNTLPPEASAEAAQVDNLLYVMVVIGGAIFLFVQGAIIFSAVRFRAAPGDKSDGVAMHGNPTLEFIWTAIPALIVLFLSVISFQVWVSITSAKDNEQVIHAQGARFTWSFSYDVPDQDLTINDNTLHTYVNQPVLMVMDTDDVIHSFYIPAMRIKQDVIPGRTTEIRFTPTLAGDYPILCAELCGAGHGDMRARIIVHEDEAAYLAWYDEKLNILLNPPEDPAERGFLVLSGGTYPCAGCHALEDLGWAGVTGPNLNDIGDRAANRVPGLTAEEYLSQSIFESNAFLVPGFGNLMPDFQFEDPDAPNFMSLEDHEAIVAYLCKETASGDAACSLENLQEIIADYE